MSHLAHYLIMKEVIWDWHRKAQVAFERGKIFAGQVQ